MSRADTLDNTSRSYELVPLIYRCTNLRCSSLTAIPRRIETLEGDEAEWPFPVNLDSLLWFTEAGIMLRGGGFWLKVKGGSGKVLDAMWLNPFYMSVSSYQQQQPAVNVTYYSNHKIFNYASTDLSGVWPADDIIYFKPFDPVERDNPGSGPAGVGLGDAKLKHYMTRFGSHFFEGGAMPVTILGVQGNPPPDDVAKVESFFSRAAKGLKNAFNVIGLRADIKVETLTPNLKDMALPDLDTRTTQDIADAFSVPLGLIRDPNNRATADIQRRSFYTETVIPSANMMASLINKDLLSDLGLQLIFDPQQMDIFQAEESERSSSLKDLVDSQVPLLTAMEVLGYDLTEEQRADIEASQVEEEPEPTPSPEQDDEQEQELDNAKATSDETKLRRKAIKAGGVVRFDSDYIDPDRQAALTAHIGACFNAGEVKGLFKAIVDPGEPGETLEESDEDTDKAIPLILAFLAKQVERINAALGFDLQVPTEFWKNEKELTYKEFLPLINSWIENSIGVWASELNQASIGLPADLNAEATKQARKHANELSGVLTNTTKELTRQKAKNYQDEGSNNRELLLAALVLAIAPRWRASMIASTEVTRGYSEGTGIVSVSLSDEGFESNKVWETAQDERVCPVCGPMHGVKADENGNYNGMSPPPAHPRCRCREVIDL